MMLFPEHHPPGREVGEQPLGVLEVVAIVGGADGLSGSVKKSADLAWSLSPLTLPHGLARVLLAEQLYRAVSILHNHPYHRA